MGGVGFRIFGFWILRKTHDVVCRNITIEIALNVKACLDAKYFLGIGKILRFYKIFWLSDWM